MARTISRIGLTVGLTIGAGLNAAPQPNATVIQLVDGTTIEGTVSGRVALGKWPSSVRLVHGADIERIDADGVRIRRGALVLAAGVSVIHGADRAKYLDGPTTPRLSILYLLASVEQATDRTRWVVPIPDRSQMVITRAPAAANVVLRGLDGAILGEYRTTDGRSELIESLTVTASAGPTRLPTSSIVAAKARAPVASASPVLTDDEHREAAAFADAFARRLRATPDVAALDDLFVADFGPRIRDHLDGSTPDASMQRAFWIVTPAPAAVAQLTDDQALRAFTATANFWTQVWIRRFSEMPFGSGPGFDPLRTLLPPEVTAIVSADPLLRDRPDRSLAQLLMTRETRPTADTAPRLMAAADTLDRAARALRAVNDAARAQESQHYRNFERTLAEQITRVRGRATPLARALTCNVDCGVLEPGTRIVEIMALPFLHLHLIRTAAGLRIHAIDVLIP